MRKNRNHSASAMALLNRARQFYKMAENSFVERATLRHALFQSYFHAAELALKAYLKAHGKERTGHHLSQLHEEARQLGLTIPGDPHALHNVLALLESGNQDMAFRYPATATRSRTEPDLDWACDVVGQLLEVVAPVVEATVDKAKVGVPVGFSISMRINNPAPQKGMIVVSPAASPSASDSGSS
ncbi:MAG: HEPN domain-containing protein [Candidatus Sulfotelmatobacter sp.]